LWIGETAPAPAGAAQAVEIPFGGSHLHR